MQLYRILVSVCVRLCVCVCVCMFLHDTSKGNQSRNTYFECMVVYENNLEKLDIGHCQIRVKRQKFSIYTAIQTVRSDNSTLDHGLYFADLEHVMKVILSRYILLEFINAILLRLSISVQCRLIMGAISQF